MTSRYPALALWRDELAKRLRTKTTFDDLWKGACSEKNAIEANADGLLDATREHLATAKRTQPIAGDAGIAGTARRSQ